MKMLITLLVTLYKQIKIVSHVANGGQNKISSVLGQCPDEHLFNLHSFPKVLFLTSKSQENADLKGCYAIVAIMQTVIWAIN